MKFFNSRQSRRPDDETSLGIKCLLLGGRNGGKSTILKQLRLMNDKVLELEYKNQEQTIISNLMKLTSENFKFLEEKELIKNEKLIEIKKKFFDSLLKERQFNEKDIGEFFFSLWKEPDAYRFLDEVINISHLQHNIKKFLKKNFFNTKRLLKKILELEDKWIEYQKDSENISSITEFYTIDEDDFLFGQRTTTSFMEVVSIPLNSNDINFKMNFYEAGGQRAVR